MVDFLLELFVNSYEELLLRSDSVFVIEVVVLLSRLLFLLLLLHSSSAMNCSNHLFVMLWDTSQWSDYCLISFHCFFHAYDLAVNHQQQIAFCYSPTISINESSYIFFFYIAWYLPKKTAYNNKKIFYKNKIKFYNNNNNNEKMFSNNNKEKMLNNKCFSFIIISFVDTNVNRCSTSW
jgi:hypothetical protein